MTRLIACLAIVGMLLSLSGCGSSTPTRPAAPSNTASQDANAVLFRAIGLVGTRYRYGGNTPSGGFDCSGLVGFVFREAASIRLPRTTSAIADWAGKKIERKRLQPGDLVFFGTRHVSHMGIYVGEGRFVHAPSSGGTVRLDPLDGAYWRARFLFGKRVLN
ncbi:MAG TPA: C40 family peptidase [Chiayiivirga sp.]|nr:C40 family peptidase [Chiayiivirga sp.]